jgi:branched-subunit amino acid transport protein
VKALGALLLASAGTYLIRVGAVRAFDVREVRPPVARMLRLAGLGTMASLVVSSLPVSSGTLRLDAPSGVGLLAATLVARRTGSATAIMAAGVAAYATGALLV